MGGIGLSPGLGVVSTLLFLLVAFLLIFKILTLIFFFFFPTRDIFLGEGRRKADQWVLSHVSRNRKFWRAIAQQKDHIKYCVFQKDRGKILKASP